MLLMARHVSLMVLDNIYKTDYYMGIEPNIDSATRPFPKFNKFHRAPIGVIYDYRTGDRYILIMTCNIGI